MNDSWIRGSYWDRAVLRWKGAELQKSGPIDIFKALREAHNILILPNDRVGGLFIGAPLYKIVRQYYPDAKITLLVDEKKASIARQIPFIDEIEIGALEKSVWGASFKRIVAQLHRGAFDLCFCLGADCSFRLAQLCSACGARLRVGFRREGLNPFNIEIVPKTSEIYEGEQYLNMLRLLGLEGRGEVRWTLSQDKAQQLRTRYLEEGFVQGHVVGIDLVPGEGRGLNQRQLEEMVGRVIERGARALLFFSLAEKKQVNYLKETYGSRVLLFEQDDLAGVAALIEGCSALISCNTDLLHLALGLQIPAVGIFVEDPKRWIPAQNHHVEVVQVEDIRTVEVDRVMAALEKALREEGRTRTTAPEGK